jgi:transcriptional regulator with XRE-family HTH domain
VSATDLSALGAELRAARLQRDLTLQDVERQIHIRAKFIEALEQGNIAALPTPIQGRGFLRNYARFVGFDPDVFVARWDEALSGGRRRVRRAGRSVPTTGRPIPRPPTYPLEPSVPRRAPILRTFALLISLIGLVGGLAVLGIGLAGQFFGGESTVSAILSPIPVTPTTATPEASPTPAPTFALPAFNTPDPNAPRQVVIVLTVVARSWVRVTVDNAVAYQGAPAPGTILQYRGGQIGVRAGNAAGLRAVVNGQDLGVLGARGQIFDQVFTPDGVLPLSATTPTATP